MKKTLSILVFLFSSIVILAQSVEYQTFIYTNDDLANEIQSLCEKEIPPAVIWEICSMPVKSLSKALHPDM